MQVKIDTLEQVLEVENAIAASFENLDLVIEAFHETTVLALNEVVSDFFPPGCQQIEKIVKAVQTTFSNSLAPTLDFGLSLFLGEVHIKDGSELFSQDISLLGRNRILEEASQDFAFFFAQVLGVFPKGLETAIQLLLVCLLQFLFQTLQFLFSDLFSGLAIMLGNMKTVDHEPGIGNFLSHGFGVGFPQITTHGLHPLQDPLRNQA